MTRSHQRLRSARCRGAIYLAVLSVAALVTVIGLSAIAALRVQRRAAETQEAYAQARRLAQSASEVVMLRITRDPFWRSTWAHDVWQSPQAIGAGSFTWKLVDEIDGNLGNDPLHPVRLYTKGMFANAVRLQSVALQANDPLPNSLLTNPGFENGTTGWFAYNCNIAQDTSDHRGGGACIKVNGRSTTTAGPRQVVTGKLNNGTPYDVEVWVKLESGSDNARVVLKAVDLFLLTTLTPMTPWTPVDTNWTAVRGQGTPSWLGILNYEHLYIETATGKSNFKVDDALVIRPGTVQVQLTPVAGSWRHEVLP